MKSLNARAAYMEGQGTTGSILVNPGASRPDILEEAIHHQQRMIYGDMYFQENRLKLEIEAQEYPSG